MSKQRAEANDRELKDDLETVSGQHRRQSLPCLIRTNVDDAVVVTDDADVIYSTSKTVNLQQSSCLQGCTDEFSRSVGDNKQQQQQHQHAAGEKEIESNQHFHQLQLQTQPNLPTTSEARSNINTTGKKESTLTSNQTSSVQIVVTPPPSISSSSIVLDAHYNYQLPPGIVFYEQNAPDVEEKLKNYQTQYLIAKTILEVFNQVNNETYENSYGGEHEHLDDLLQRRSPSLPDNENTPLFTSFEEHQLLINSSTSYSIHNSQPQTSNMQGMRNMIFPVSSTLSVMRTKPSRLFYRSEREFWNTDSKFEDQLNVDDPVPRPFGKIPGPRALPLLGNIWRYLPYIGVYNIEKLDANGRYNLARYGKIVREEVTKDHRIVWLFDPANMDELFQQEGRYPCRRSHRALLKYRHERPNMYRSGGIFPENGAEWARLRDLFKQHFLLRRNIDAYTGQLVGVANDLLSFVDNRLDPVSHECVDFQEDLYRWALESICLIMLDARIGCLDPANLVPESDASRLIDAAHETIDAVMRTELYNDWETKNRPTKDYLRLVSGQNVMAEIVNKHLKKKLNDYNPSEPQDEQSKTLLERFITSPEVDRKDLFTMILDFVLAGIDTTSITAGFALYYLARHQDIQEKVRKEIINVVGNREIKPEDFSQMPLLRACIKETMRLRPISVGVGRLANADISIGGYQVPKDTMLITMNQVSCQLEEYFENANKFIPERWLKKDAAAAAKKDFRNRFLWLPFGHGPRMCMGRRIAELEMRILLCTVLRNYQVNYHYEDIGVKTCLINVPDRPMKFQLIKLEGHN